MESGDDSGVENFDYTEEECVCRNYAFCPKCNVYTTYYNQVQPQAPPAQIQSNLTDNEMGYHYVPQASALASNAEILQFRPQVRPPVLSNKQPFLSTSTGPLLYPTMLFQPTHLSILRGQTRSTTPGYYPYMPYVYSNTNVGNASQLPYNQNYFNTQVGSSGTSQIQNPVSQSTQFQNPVPQSTQFQNPVQQSTQFQNLVQQTPFQNSDPQTTQFQNSVPQSTQFQNLVQQTPFQNSVPQTTQFQISVPQTSQFQPQQMINKPPPNPVGRQEPPKRISRRLAIINPVTQQDIFLEDSSSRNQQNNTTEESDVRKEKSMSVVEEFTRKVREIALQPSKHETEPKITPKRRGIIITNPNVKENSHKKATVETEKSEPKTVKLDPKPKNDTPLENPVPKADDCAKISVNTTETKDVPEITKNITVAETCSVEDSNLNQTNISTEKKPDICINNNDESELCKNVTANTDFPEADPTTNVKIDSSSEICIQKTKNTKESKKVHKGTRIFTKSEFKKPQKVDKQESVPVTEVISKEDKEVLKQYTEKPKVVKKPPLETIKEIFEVIDSIKPEIVTKITEEQVTDISATVAQTNTHLKVSAADNVKETMKDLNNTNTEPETANGNVSESTENINDVNKNESEVSNKSEKGENDNETDKSETKETLPVPKHKYGEGQWSPQNPEGKKTYDVRLLMQIKSDPLSRKKPEIPLLETCHVLRDVPQFQDAIFTQIQRPVNDSLFPNFLRNQSSGIRSPAREKRDGRHSPLPGKGSMKLNSPNPNTRNIFISLREEVKLNESKDAWKPSRLKKENLSEEEKKTQDLYKKFRGILNKLTPQKFEKLMEKVKALEIDTQARLQGVIDLVFEKAIEEPNFSEAYAALCNRLSTIRVPSATSPDKCVNFRGMIISRCQSQFIAEKTDENILRLEKEVAECTDPAKKKELQLQLEENHRRVRMRSVGNVRFIGELYKLKMLTAKIMVVCMDYLIDKVEEEKLECLCKLLTTIGQQVESEVKEPLDAVFKRMQGIVQDRKTNKISSRVRFMMQDVIELRGRKWVAKNVMDSQPKTIDQIQKEAEQEQRHIELMNSSVGGGGGGRKRDNRRQGNFDNAWKTTPTRTSYTVDTSKLKAMQQKDKNVANVKLGPPKSAWNYGSSTQKPVAPVHNNMYSILEHDQADPVTLKNKDLMSGYQQSKSIERSTFSSRSDINPQGRSVSTSGSMSTPKPVDRTPVDQTPVDKTPVDQEPLPDAKKKRVKELIELCVMNPNDEEMVEEIKLLDAKYHASIITEILNVALEKSSKDFNMICKSVVHVIKTGTISPENLVIGVSEILEYAPDLFLDIPLLYDYLGRFVAPHIENKNISLAQIHKASSTVISSQQGHHFLRAILKELKERMGATFTSNKWAQSGLKYEDWMSSDMVSKWLSDNHFEFLEGSGSEEKIPEMSSSEIQSKLLHLMNNEENCDCIRGWIKDKIATPSAEFLRCLTQAVCEYSIGPDRRLNQDRMNKYSPLIGEYTDSPEREAACLFGIQQLVHRLEHPQGLTLDIFQYLHEQYIISVEGFIAWETSEKEPEGKGVMLKALTSFLTSIREADNDDSSDA